jgi:hypothetical protein
MAAITDPRYGEARFSLGKIEGWIESVSKDFKLVPTNVLKDLNAVEEALRYFARSAAKFMHAAQEKEKEVKKQSLAEGTEGTQGAVVHLHLTRAAEHRAIAGSPSKRPAVERCERGLQSVERRRVCVALTVGWVSRPDKFKFPRVFA